MEVSFVSMWKVLTAFLEDHELETGSYVSKSRPKVILPFSPPLNTQLGKRLGCFRYLVGHKMHIFSNELFRPRVGDASPELQNSGALEPKALSSKNVEL